MYGSIWEQRGIVLRDRCSLAKTFHPLQIRDKVLLAHTRANIAKPLSELPTCDNAILLAKFSPRAKGGDE